VLLIHHYTTRLDEDGVADRARLRPAMSYILQDLVGQLRRHNAAAPLTLPCSKPDPPLPPGRPICVSTRATGRPWPVASRPRLGRTVVLRPGVQHGKGAPGLVLQLYGVQGRADQR
jgi:hypothetical protein